VSRLAGGHGESVASAGGRNAPASSIPMAHLYVFAGRFRGYGQVTPDGALDQVFWRTNLDGKHGFSRGSVAAPF